MYRKKGKITKSIKQYKKERGRRKKVMELHDKGYTQQQIADELGVSRKTVQRDLKKLARYLKSLTNRRNRELDEKLRASFKATLNRLPIVKQYELVSGLMALGFEDKRKMNNAVWALIRGDIKKAWRALSVSI